MPRKKRRAKKTIGGQKNLDSLFNALVKGELKFDEIGTAKAKKIIEAEPVVLPQTRSSSRRVQADDYQSDVLYEEDFDIDSLSDDAVTELYEQAMEEDYQPDMLHGMQSSFGEEDDTYSQNLNALKQRKSQLDRAEQAHRSRLVTYRDRLYVEPDSEEDSEDYVDIGEEYPDHSPLDNPKKTPWMIYGAVGLVAIGGGIWLWKRNPST